MPLVVVIVRQSNSWTGAAFNVEIIYFRQRSGQGWTGCAATFQQNYGPSSTGMMTAGKCSTICLSDPSFVFIEGPSVVYESRQAGGGRQVGKQTVITSG